MCRRTFRMGMGKTANRIVQVDIITYIRTRKIVYSVLSVSARRFFCKILVTPNAFGDAVIFVQIFFEALLFSNPSLV